MSKQKFTEVEFKRIVTRDPDDDQKITVSFERIRVVKENVCLTVAQAAILNAGKTTYAGNIEFTLLLKEGEADPAPQVLEVQIENKASRSGQQKFDFRKPRLGQMNPEFAKGYFKESGFDEASRY